MARKPKPNPQDEAPQETPDVAPAASPNKSRKTVRPDGLVTIDN